MFHYDIMFVKLFYSKNLCWALAVATIFLKVYTLKVVAKKKNLSNAVFTKGHEDFYDNIYNFLKSLPFDTFA